MKILCIIPIYNEDKRLNDLLNDIKLFKTKDNQNIDFLLINNNSNDKTLDIIKSFNFKFITLKKNFGIGHALLLGLKIANYLNYEILVHMAGNNKMSPFDIQKVLQPIFDNNIDYVSGTRFRYKRNYENNPIFRKVSIKLLSLIFSLLFRRKITDATCGFRAFRIKKIFKYFKFFNKKKYYTYGYEYYSYGKVLLSKEISSCEADVKMNYPKKGKYSKIRPFIDWYPIIFGYIEALFDKNKIK